MQSGSYTVKKSRAKRNRPAKAFGTCNSNKVLLPALVAVGSGMGALPAAALELGEVTVHSTLGQALRASIPIALAPNEQITNSCVSLQRASSSDGMPAINDARISIANGVISLTGKSAIREPMLTMHVNIKCPYTPNLSREYMLFLDPPGMLAQPAADASVSVATSAQVSAPPVTSTRASAARSTVERSPVKNRTPVGTGVRYQVQPGDSLSEIVQRIENRSVGLWPAVMTVFELNPTAFIDNDPNRIKAGSWLTIPDLGGAVALVPASDSSANINTTSAPASVASTRIEAGVEDNGAAYDGSAIDQAIAEDTGTAISEAATNAPLADLQPGDVILDADNPYVTPAGSAAVETIILDTPIESPEIAGTPNGNTFAISTGSESNATESSNLLVWLAGSGIAIFVALLFFGRRMRNRFGSAPIGAVLATQPERRRTDDNTETLEAVSDLDFGLSDDSPTEENLVLTEETFELDADLISGNGLEQNSDMHVAQDFGFAATTQLDMELPEEMSSGGEYSATDIIPPMKMDVQSILESEVLSGEDDYDMSVIVDATQMPIPEDVTERDLKAVPVDVNDATLISDDYTVSKEPDFDILEQDYEDEMTATQALNQEIAKAALELADHMDLPAEAGFDDVTSEMPLASVTELDVTAQLPIDHTDASDTDATSMLQEQTAEFAIDDQTVEMPANDADVTAEIPVDARKSDTKAS
jgi:hypothetical protein